MIYVEHKLEACRRPCRSALIPPPWFIVQISFNMGSPARSVRGRFKAADPDLESSHHLHCSFKSQEPSTFEPRSKRRRLNNSSEFLHTHLSLNTSNDSLDATKPAPTGSFTDVSHNGKRYRVKLDKTGHRRDNNIIDAGTTAKNHVYQPSKIDPGKRVLRSADGTSRSESDLAYFFPDYDELVFGSKKPPGMSAC